MLYMFVCLGCGQNDIYPAGPVKVNAQPILQPSVNVNPFTSIHEIPLPGGFTRVKTNRNSFAEWLRSIPLKKDKTVFKFDGRPKANQSAQFAILDISVGTKDLQQCADAVMRLRAEYLLATKQSAAIHFKDNDGRVYQFDEPHTHRNLHRYLQVVFAKCGSASLSKQLASIPVASIEPGDVFIRGGFPGHAVIVMDVAVNKAGNKIYLLAQSYMPAQDIHVLVNPTDKTLSPWYEVTKDDLVQTPEYTFRNSELKGW